MDTEDMFAVYYNTMEKHVTIHKPRAHKRERNDGKHQYEQGGWGYFIDEKHAVEYANQIHLAKKLPKPSHCKLCYEK